jgi:hypothetical protein
VPTKREELEWHDNAYREFRSLVDSIEEPRFEERWLDGRWGVREIVAHLTGWHYQFGAGLERMNRGERPSPQGVDWTDVQTWNDHFAHEAQGKSKADVLRDLDEAVARFHANAERLPEERFGPGKTASRMLAENGHFNTHAAQIRGWLVRQPALNQNRP